MFDPIFIVCIYALKFINSVSMTWTCIFTPAIFPSSDSGTPRGTYFFPHLWNSNIAYDIWLPIIYLPNTSNFRGLIYFSSIFTRYGRPSAEVCDSSLWWPMAWCANWSYRDLTKWKLEDYCCISNFTSSRRSHFSTNGGVHTCFVKVCKEENEGC